jgi:hypothetical protein
MAAQAWKFFNRAKFFLCEGTIDLNSTTFDLHLFQSASDFATATQSTLGQLSSEVASGNGYTQSGKVMTTTWTLGASASEFRFDANDLVWTGTGGSIANVKAAVIVARTAASGKASTNKLLCYASLSSGQFTVSLGNTLTIGTPANGIFELN